MNKTIKNQFLKHAKEQMPREACALGVVVKGRLRLFICPNQSENMDEFCISADDWIKAEELGTIACIIHSHVDCSNLPSVADKVACEHIGLPWYIVSLVDDSWNEIVPTGYVPDLIGREFYHGVVDCYTLCSDWYKINRNIDLPHFHRKDDWWANGENLYVDNFESAGFEKLPTIDGELDFASAQPGDAFLMQIQSDVPNHAAIYLGDGVIIHHLHGRLSSRDVFGGYYQKHTTHILRYKL